MGVIRNVIKPEDVCRSQSEESLHIAQSSDDERSLPPPENEIMHFPNRSPKRHRRLNVPTSFSSLRKRCGRKQLQRYDNAIQLMTLVEDEELTELTVHDFMVTDRSVPFSRLVLDDSYIKTWNNFIYSSEENQNMLMLCSRNIEHKSIQNPSSHQVATPEEAFQNINHGFRNALKKSHVPLGIIRSLEESLIEFFISNPEDVYVSQPLSSYERLLLHALSQYHQLKSFSFNSEPGNQRLVRVSNPLKLFQPVLIPLCNFLESRKSVTS